MCNHMHVNLRPVLQLQMEPGATEIHWVAPSISNAQNMSVYASGLNVNLFMHNFMLTASFQKPAGDNKYHVRRGKHDCSEASHLQDWNKLLTYSSFLWWHKCWLHARPCCLSQLERRILHVHHTCVWLCMVCVCVWYGSYGVVGVSLTRRVRLRFISDCQRITVITICSQLQPASGRNIWSPLLWAPRVARNMWKTQVQPLSAILTYLQIRVSELEMSAPTQLITTVLLFMRALLNICPQTLTFLFNSLHTSFNMHFLFHRRLTNKKKKPTSNTPQAQSLKDIILRK